MAGVDTLNKFGVPFSDSAGASGQLQPKSNYRFRVVTINFGSGANQGDLTRQVATVDRPTLTHNTIEVDSYNSKSYYAGKHNWSEINLVVRDDISNIASRLVGEQLQKQLDHFEQTGFVAAINYKFTMYIDTLDGGNTRGIPGSRVVPGANNGILERWCLEGCYIANTDYSNLDYSSSEYQTITMQIRPDNCTLIGHSGTQVILPSGNENLESGGLAASATGPGSLLG